MQDKNCGVTWMDFNRPFYRMVKAFTPFVRRSRSFKVTDFGTNRKLIYEFLLVINRLIQLFV